jgi:CBS domain containing-hemolysin-like protein
MTGSVWAVLAALILANSLYVVAEFGAVGVQRSRIRRMADERRMLARLLLPYLDSPAALDRYVGASQIGITLASLLLGAYAQATIGASLAPLLQQWFTLTPVGAVSASAAGVLILLTAVQLVVGELVPKAVALQYPTEAALATVLPMRWSLVVFRPFIGILNGTAVGLLRLFGVSERGHRHLHSPEEIDLLIAESRDGGMLEPEEQQRLRRALHLGLQTARDLMVPRDRLTMLAIDTPWEEIVRTIVASPFSRLPVYRDSRDQIVGLLRVKDLVEHYAAEGASRLERLLRPVVQVPAGLPADRVVTLLRDRRAHAAIVVDEDGRTIGFITIQDLLEELLGQPPAGGETPRPRTEGRA